MYTNYPNTEKNNPKKWPKRLNPAFGLKKKITHDLFRVGCLLHSFYFVFLNYYLSENIFIVYAYLFVIIYSA